MSGGSFDYLYRKMEDGDALAFRYAMEEEKDDYFQKGLLARMDEAIKALVDGDDDAYYDRETRKFMPHPRPGEAIAAVAKMRARFVAAKQDAERLKETLAALAPTARAIEWWASGDTGVYDFIEECMK